jgi:hypothetical protein
MASGAVCVQYCEAILFQNLSSLYMKPEASGINILYISVNKKFSLLTCSLELVKINILLTNILKPW